MKALMEMDNVEKGYLLAKLFPERLKDLTSFIQRETERFRTNEDFLHSNWGDNTLITSSFWYGLVGQTEQILKRYNAWMYTSPRLFSDQLFDGYIAIFTTNCLMEYMDDQECDQKFKQAVHLLFGQEKIIVITLEDK